MSAVSAAQPLVNAALELLLGLPITATRQHGPVLATAPGPALRAVVPILMPMVSAVQPLANAPRG